MSDELHDEVDDLTAQLRPPTEAEGEVRAVYLAVGGLQNLANELSQALSHRAYRYEFRRLPPRQPADSPPQGRGPASGPDELPARTARRDATAHEPRNR